MLMSTGPDSGCRSGRRGRAARARARWLRLSHGRRGAGTGSDGGGPLWQAAKSGYLCLRVSLAQAGHRPGRRARAGPPSHGDPVHTVTVAVAFPVSDSCPGPGRPGHSDPMPVPLRMLTMTIMTRDSRIMMMPAASAGGVPA